MQKAKGITLVALVITVIVMLILAGVALNLSIGENGIFKKASQGAEIYAELAKKEENDLAEVEELLQGQTVPKQDLPDITPETKHGTLVKVPDKWLSYTPNYIEHGKEVVSSKTIATVNAVSVGNGEMVPVPIGFYYVGGTVQSGVVISDNEADKNKFAGMEDVPSGLKQNAEGNIEYEIVGNQFVWIPCQIEEYVKTNWGQGNIVTVSTSCWDTSIDKSGKMQTEKYGGFYVARFEAGLDNSIEEFTIKQQLSSQVYNQEGMPQSKPGVIPWNYIDWNHSQINAEKMYDTSTVRSGLITGTQWDVMVNWMTNKNDTELANSGSFGNYITSTSIITLGKTAYTYINEGWNQECFADDWKINIAKPIGTANTNKNGKAYLLTTGASEEAKKKNLYDVAGNLWEWTEEISFYGGNVATQYRVLRGGSFIDSPSSYSIRSRYGNYSINTSYLTNGFRVVLYLK